MIDEKKNIPEDDEEEIFKTLGHKIRRDIIKIIGAKEKLTFSEIRKKLGSTESPILSYHLKFLQPLIMQKDGKYLLNKIGLAAFNLLTKTDESVKISKYKKNFTYAHIVTIICWAIASVLVPFPINNIEDRVITLILINIIIGATSAINQSIIGFLRHKY